MSDYPAKPKWAAFVMNRDDADARGKAPEGVAKLARIELRAPVGGMLHSDGILT